MSDTADPIFARCIRNSEHAASLEFGKLYQVFPDAFGDEHQMTRVVDESGESYLYPDSFFERIADETKEHA